MSRAYWLAVLERAVKTAVQVAVALLTTEATGVTDVEWQGLLSAVGLATLVSVLTSLGSIQLAPGDGPAAFGPEKVDEAPKDDRKAGGGTW